MRVLDHATWRRYVAAQAVVTAAIVVGVAVGTLLMVSGTRASSRAGCERGKLDRKANAAAWGAHAAYIVKVTRAKSVKEDVKRAARVEARTATRVAADLIARSTLDCERLYPSPWGL